MRQWLEFGPYRLDAFGGVLFRDNLPVSLTPKAIEVLRVLAQAEGSVVTKETLFKEVWAGTFVEESSISKNISELRSVLGDSVNGAAWIETFPRRGYRFTVPVRRIEEARRGPPSGKRTLSISPFRIIGTVGDESIGLRVVDALTTRLASVKALIVRPAAATANDPGADLVLEGSVQEFLETIRVTTQLLDTKSDNLVWGDTFDKGSHDVPDELKSLAEEVAGALAMFASAEDRELVSRRYTDNRQAYQFYLRGRFYWSQRSVKGISKALPLFRKAIDLDPEFALAYSGLGASYAMLPMLTSGIAKRFMPRARTAAARALDLDESLVEARTALAFVKWHYDFDWRWAKREFKAALKFRPDQAATHQWYGLLLAEMGRREEAIAEMKNARDLDPDSGSILANFATVYYLAGLYRESLAMAEASQAIEPESIRAHWVIGVSLEQLGKLDDAIRAFGDGCRLSKEAPPMLGSLGHTYALAGRVNEAVAILRNLRRRRPRHFYFEEALVTLGLGDLPEAVALLEKACDERQFHAVLLRSDARFKCLLPLPMFQAILSRIGLCVEPRSGTCPARAIQQ